MSALTATKETTIAGEGRNCETLLNIFAYLCVESCSLDEMQ